MFTFEYWEFLFLSVTGLLNGMNSVRNTYEVVLFFSKHDLPTWFVEPPFSSINNGSLSFSVIVGYPNMQYGLIKMWDITRFRAYIIIKGPPFPKRYAGTQGLESREGVVHILFLLSSASSPCVVEMKGEVWLEKKSKHLYLAVAVGVFSWLLMALMSLEENPEPTLSLGIWSTELWANERLQF